MQNRHECRARESMNEDSLYSPTKRDTFDDEDDDEDSASAEDKEGEERRRL